MTRDIQNWKANFSRTIPPAFYEKGPLNVGPLITEIRCEFGPTQMDFWETILRPLGCAAPSNFIHARD